MFGINRGKKINLVVIIMYVRGDLLKYGNVYQFGFFIYKFEFIVKYIIKFFKKVL